MAEIRSSWWRPQPLSELTRLSNGELIVAARNDLLALCDAYDALAELIAVEDADIPLSEFKRRHREAVKRARRLLGEKRR